MTEATSPAVRSDELVVRPATDADEPAVLALLHSALGGGPTGARTSAFFRWKHQHNPFGTSLALVAEAGGEIVGFRTLMRWRFTAAGHRVRAVRAVDTATRPDWQSRGVFSRLTAAAREQLRGDADLIFNTPNAKSLPGYRKLGWSEVGGVPIRLRPVRPLRLAINAKAARAADGEARPLSGLGWARAGEVLADRDAVTDLLAESGGDGRLATDHDAATLVWRYSDCPDLDYRAVAVPGPGGSYAGVAIGRLRARGRLRELTLSELRVRRGDRVTAGLLLRLAARTGADHIAAHLADGTEASAVAGRHGYLPVPGRGLTLVAHPLTDVAPDPLAWRSWRLALGDLEVF